MTHVRKGRTAKAARQEVALQARLAARKGSSHGTDQTPFELATEHLQKNRRIKNGRAHSGATVK